MSEVEGPRDESWAPRVAPPPTGKFWWVGGITLGAPAAFHASAFLLASGFGCGGGAAGPLSEDEQRRCDDLRLRSNVAIAVNVGAVTVGLAGVIAGAVQDTRFDDWRGRHRFTPPRDGSGLLGAGVGLLAYAPIYAASTGPYWFYDSGSDDPTTGLMYGGTIAALTVAGAVFTTLGGLRRRDYNRSFGRRYSLLIEPQGPGRFAFGLTERR